MYFSGLCLQLWVSIGSVHWPSKFPMTHILWERMKSMKLWNSQTPRAKRKYQVLPIMHLPPNRSFVQVVMWGDSDEPCLKYKLVMSSVHSRYLSSLSLHINFCTKYSIESNASWEVHHIFSYTEQCTIILISMLRRIEIISAYQSANNTNGLKTRTI